MMRIVLSLIAAGAFLAACGEREQVAEGTRTYQGKSDTKPWDTWNKGDQASWEQQIKARQMTQNEYRRMAR